MPDDPVICLGRVFRNAQPTDDPHPQVIASDPTKDPNRVVVINLSSWPSRGDHNRFTLEKGDSPMISHTSYPRCEDAALMTLADLNRLVERGKVNWTKCLAPAALQKVQRAIDQSRRVSGAVRTVIRTQGIIQIGPQGSG